MSKRVSNKKGSQPRASKQARRRVRYGWRKKRAREIIRQHREQQQLNAIAAGGVA